MLKPTLQLAFLFSNDKLARMKNIVPQLVLFISAIFIIACGGGGQDVPDQSQDEPHTNAAEGENPEEEEK